MDTVDAEIHRLRGVVDQARLLAGLLLPMTDLDAAQRAFVTDAVQALARRIERDLETLARRCPERTANGEERP